MKQFINKLNIDFKKENMTSQPLIKNESNTMNTTSELNVNSTVKDIHNIIENPNSSSKSESNSFRKEFNNTKQNDAEVEIISNRETLMQIKEEDTNIKKFLNNLEKKIIQTEKDFISIDESIGNVFINNKEKVLKIERKYSQKSPKLNNLNKSPEKNLLIKKLNNKSLNSIKTDEDILSGNQKTNLSKSKFANYLSSNLDLINLKNKSIILNSNTNDNTAIYSRSTKKNFTNKIISNNDIKDAASTILRNFTNKNIDKSLNRSGFKRKSEDQSNHKNSIDKLENKEEKDNISITDNIENKENSDSFNNTIVSPPSVSPDKKPIHHKISKHKRVPQRINSDSDDRASLKNYKNVYDSMDDGGGGDNNIEVLIQDHYEEDPWVFSKNSKFRNYWSTIIFFLILYSTTASPYKIAFYQDDNTDISYLDLSVDMIFVIDIGLNFFTPYYDHDNNLVGNHKMIVYNYITTWLLFDAISSFPTDLFNIFLNKSIEHSGNNSYSLEIKKLIRLSRLYRFGKWLKVVRFLKLAQDANSYSAMNFVYSLELNRLFIFVIMLVILVHIASCLWIFVGKLDDDVQNWIFHYDYSNYANFDLYITSVYFTFCTVSTIGYGDIVSQSTTERVYNNILLVVGVILFSFCL